MNEVYGQFRRQVYVDNPHSPIRLGKSKRTVKIKSITFLKTRKGDKGFTAQIRFTTKDGRAKEKHLVATMAFDYQDLSLTSVERAINPLGFQVLSYRTDNEVL
jgi:type IV secretion system protein VirB8